MISALYLMVLIGYVFLTVGVLTRKSLFTGLMGALLVVVGLYVVGNGIGNVNDDVTEIFGLITTLVGAGFFLTEAAKELENIQI